MPQHPQYSNSPKRDLDRLYALLNELELFGYMHEEIHQPIDAIMNELYKKKSNIQSVVAPESDDDDDDDDDDDLDIEDFDEDDYDMSASSLFYEIPEATRPQYIQDLRNVIAHCMSSNAWITDGVANEIIAMRDPEYYQMHVRLVEDTDTLEKYRYCKRTQWFDKGIKPSLAGVYEIAKSQWDLVHDGFAYWDGKSWYEKSILLSGCLKTPKAKRNKNDIGYFWRGFTESQDEVD